MRGEENTESNRRTYLVRPLCRSSSMPLKACCSSWGYEIETEHGRRVKSKQPHILVHLTLRPLKAC